MVVPFADRTSPVSRQAGRLGFSASSGPSVGLTAGVSAVALLTARLVSPDHAEHGPVLCPFRLATGLPCPGCGLTRSWVDLVHGRVGDAMSANPFGVVVLGLALMLLVAVGSRLLRRRPLPTYGEIFGAGRLSRRAGAVLVAAWLAFALVRLVAVAIG